MTVVLRPSWRPDPPVRLPLADRSGTLNRVAIVATMPPGSGVQPIAAALRDALTSQGIAAELVERRVHLSVDPDDQRVLGSGGFDGVIFVVGPSTTVLSVAYAAASQLEDSGLPSVLLVPHTLRTQNEHEATRSQAAVRAVVATSTEPPDVAPLLVALTAAPSAIEQATTTSPESRESAHIEGSDDELHRLFEVEGWSDGLPVVLPTEERVAAMLGGTRHSPETIVAEELPPEGGTVTVRDVAICAVMAGADPVHLPVILAATSLAGDRLLDPMTRSVNSFAFAQLVSGPYAEIAGMHGGLGALSPGTKGNAVVGRSLSLVQRNVGRARLGASISPVQGSVAAMGFAFTENHEETPWAPFHVRIGYAPHESTVTLFSGGQTHLGNFYYDDLEEIAAAMTSVDLYSGALVLLSAKRAQVYADRGMNANDVAAQLHALAKIPLGDFRSSGFYPLRSSGIERGGPGTWPKSYLNGDDAELVPAFPPGSVQVAVVGSALSSLVQVWLMRMHRTASIDDWV